MMAGKKSNKSLTKLRHEPVKGQTVKTTSEAWTELTLTDVELAEERVETVHLLGFRNVRVVLGDTLQRQLWHEIDNFVIVELSLKQVQSYTQPWQTLSTELKEEKVLKSSRKWMRTKKLLMETGKVAENIRTYLSFGSRSTRRSAYSAKSWDSSLSACKTRKLNFEMKETKNWIFSIYTRLWYNFFRKYSYISSEYQKSYLPRPKLRSCTCPCVRRAVHRFRTL